MKRLRLKLYYVSPTHLVSHFTTLTCWEGDHFYDDLNRVFLRADLEAIKRGERPWLRLEGDLPTRGTN